MISALLLVMLAAEPARPKLAVSDFAAPKESQAIASAANSLVANELQRIGAFEVSTADQLRTLLGYERQQQLLGCSSDSCSSNLAANINMDYLVTGQLTRIKGTGNTSSYSLDLQLVSVKSGRREKGETVTGATEQQLIVNVTPAVVKLVQPILKDRSGSLVMLSSEAGSTVKVDDVVVGVTPLDSRITLAGGPHIVAVEKDGYVTWQKEVRVTPGGLAEESARLVPSPDTIEAYESKQTKLRIGAYSSTGLAVAGIAAGVVFQFLASQEYNSNFASAREKLNQGVESGDVDGTTVDYRAVAGASKAKITTYQLVSFIGIGVGAAAAVAATVLWVLSEDPGKYRAYRNVSIAFMPTLNGGFAALTGHF